MLAEPFPIPGLQSPSGRPGGSVWPVPGSSDHLTPGHMSSHGGEPAPRALGPLYRPAPPFMFPGQGTWNSASSASLQVTFLLTSVLVSRGPFKCLHGASCVRWRPSPLLPLLGEGAGLWHVASFSILLTRRALALGPYIGFNTLIIMFSVIPAP